MPLPKLSQAILISCVMCSIACCCGMGLLASCGGCENKLCEGPVIVGCSGVLEHS